MVRDPAGTEPSPELQTVLDALDDPDCREIVRVLGEPMTADEIADSADIPLSTTYRKLELLTEASLLAEGLEIRADGQHASRYSVDFESVVVSLAEDRTLEASVTRAPRSPEERLASIWSEVRKET